MAVTRRGSAGRLVVRRPSCFGVAPATRVAAKEDTLEVEFQELKRWLLDGRIAAHLLRYRHVLLLTSRVDHVSKPFPTALLLRLLSRGSCAFVDDRGSQVPIGLGALVTYLFKCAGALVRLPLLLHGVGRRVRRLRRGARRPPAPLDRRGAPVYLRGDLVFGLQAGGAVGHVAGVLNNLDRFAGAPVFVTTERLPTVRAEIETHVVEPGSDFCGFEEIPNFHFAGGLGERAFEAVRGRRVAFVYQRYCFGSLAGPELAERLGVPFVLEYNGSEVWINRNWGRPLRHARLAIQIEDVLLTTADLVVVVSRALRNELVERGVPDERILVNPNGVDVERYSPLVDGSGVRLRYGLEDRQVVGFIGTFGRWHGAEQLAEAFGLLMARRPEWRASVRLLMIGDGPMVSEVEERLQRHQVRELAVLTGLVPQPEGASHLAACDVLASPHVRNADGSAFFGSPTKLFEYMATGRGIVASNLDQIGEVLSHERTALLVEPGDARALAAAIERLVDDRSLSARLGAAARAEAVATHSWTEHTRRIVDALERRLAGAAPAAP